MEFDKSRVYTAVNADELPIGSRCLFANSLKDLKDRIYLTDTYGRILEYVCDENEEERFYGDDATYLLAYLIEPPSNSDQKERKYKPFSNIENLKKSAVKYIGFIKSKQGTQEGIIIGISFDNRVIIKKRYGVEYLTTEQLFESYTFDDGSPCGELVEE